MGLSYKSIKPDQTIVLGGVLGRLLQPGDIVLLSGDLGAGKTQLAKGIAGTWGIKEAITSPTFNIMFEHYAQEKSLLRHFDLYRLESTQELDDIDYFGLLEDGALSIVEWGDKFVEAMPKEYLMVTIKIIDETTRKIDLEAIGCRYEELICDLHMHMVKVSNGAKTWPLT